MQTPSGSGSNFRPLVVLFGAVALLGLATVAAARTRTARTAACRISWSVDPSPAVAGAELFAIAAAGPHDAWAVGGPSNFSHSKARSRALAEHFDGRRWRLVPSPPVAGVLEGVAIAGRHDVWAVGERGAFSSRTGNPPPPREALIEHWNGARWTLVDVPGARRLSAVAAVSAHDLWAVGSGSAGTAVILHWDGTRWRRFTRANTELFGLVAISHRDVWAVGDTAGGRFLELHWDGRRWSAYTQLPPNGGDGPDGGAELVAVSAARPSDVWAAGDAENSDEPAWPDTVLLHWDGSHWYAVSTRDSWMWVDALVARSLGSVVLSGVTGNGDAYGTSVARLWRNGRWYPTRLGDGELAALASDRAGGLWGAGFTYSASDPLGFPTATWPVVERGRCS